jgi:hypothetical protein
LWRRRTMQSSAAPAPCSTLGIWGRRLFRPRFILRARLLWIARQPLALVSFFRFLMRRPLMPGTAWLFDIGLNWDKVPHKPLNRPLGWRCRLRECCGVNATLGWARSHHRELDTRSRYAFVRRSGSGSQVDYAALPVWQEVRRKARHPSALCPADLCFTSNS